jgi:hypothetical protein
VSYLERAGWLVGPGRSVSKATGPRPSEDVVTEQYLRLWREPSDVLQWLIQERGLRRVVVRAFGLGDDGHGAVTIPIRDEEGRLHNIKRRYIRRSGSDKARGLARPALLYPLRVLESAPRAVVLCEGELDALLLVQHGIPAVTSTAGTNGWELYPEWNRYFVGRRVAVVYDQGQASLELALERARKLKSAGAREAWPVDLGLGSVGDDIGDWFVRYGKSAAAFREVINAAGRVRSRREDRS